VQSEASIPLGTASTIVRSALWRHSSLTTGRRLLVQSCSGSPLLVLPQVSVERTFVPWLPIIAEGKHSYDHEYQLPTEAP